MSSRQKVTRRELGVLAAFLVPLGILAVSIAFVPLEAYGNPDPRAFVARSLKISRDWTSIIAIKDPPLRYAPLALIYSFGDLAYIHATAIGSAFGALTVYVVSPLTMWAFARRVASPRVALLALLGLIGNIVLFPAEHWVRPVAAWQYYVVLPWIFAAFAGADWTLAANARQSRRRRAVVTGLLIAAAGLTQLLFAGVAALIVAVACLLRRRVRTLVEITATGLPFAGYYLVSAAARKQLIGGSSRRTVAEPLFPITIQEIAFLAVVACGLVLWYRNRRSISPVIGAGLIVIGLIWSFAVLKSGEYLSYFLPVLAVPIMLTGLATGVCATIDVPRIPHISRPILIPALMIFSVGLTVLLLDSVLPTYPFWNM